MAGCGRGGYEGTCGKAGKAEEAAICENAVQAMREAIEEEGVKDASEH